MVPLKTIALSLAAATAAPVMAETTPDFGQHKTRIVRYGDLDLSAEKDRQRLVNRIARAIEKVCARPLAFTSREKHDLARCKDRAIAHASRQATAAIASYQANGRLAAERQTAVVGN